MDICRETRNKQSIQQLMLLALLNRHCTIVLKKTRKSVLTAQFVGIERIEFNDDDMINVSEFLTRRVKEQYDFDISHGVDKKTAIRRMQTNRRIETMRLLVDLLVELGYTIIAKYAKGKHETNKMDIIESITYKGNALHIHSQSIGDELNEFFSAHTEASGLTKITMNNENLSNIMSSIM